jgi:hypothetical protein
MKISRREFIRLGGALAASICAPALARETPAGIPVLLYHDISGFLHHFPVPVLGANGMAP